jgi:23S rRNA pseudouridine2605 synthase
MNTPEQEANSEDARADEYSGHGERLQKLIARAGIASRRAAEELIASGRVAVNGEVVKELGAKANPQTDRVTVDGKVLALEEKAATVVLLHKPRGTVTTKSDPEKRATVLDLLPRKYKTLHPVGRLDFDTSGVLLLTDDGELTHLLTHPSHGVEKVYHVRVGGQVKPETLKRLQSGVWIGEGAERVKTAPCRAKLIAQTENNALLEIALREGRNRQVRRMMEAVGHPVSSLRRVSFAGVGLEGLPPGVHRVLLPGEVHQLKKRVAHQLEKAQHSREITKAAAPSKAPQKPKPKPKPKPRNQSVPLGERIRREWK